MSVSDDAPRTRDLPDVLDAQQVAQLLGLNLDYVRKLSREGTIPAHRIPHGRSFRYLKDEVIQWLREQPATTSDDQDSTEGARSRSS